MKRSGTRLALLAADAFVGLTAMGGGIALVTGMEGDRFPPEYLLGTPFTGYHIPGLLLAGVVGGSATIAAISTMRSNKASGLLSLVAGVIMMGWIVGELLILNQPSWTWIELFYFAIGLLMAVLGLRAQRNSNDKVS